MSGPKYLHNNGDHTGYFKTKIYLKMCLFNQIIQINSWNLYIKYISNIQSGIFQVMPENVEDSSKQLMNMKLECDI